MLKNKGILFVLASVFVAGQNVHATFQHRVGESEATRLLRESAHRRMTRQQPVTTSSEAGPTAGSAAEATTEDEQEVTQVQNSESTANSQPVERKNDVQDQISHSQPVEHKNVVQNQIVGLDNKYSDQLDSDLAYVQSLQHSDDSSRVSLTPVTRSSQVQTESKANTHFHWEMPEAENENEDPKDVMLKGSAQLKIPEGFMSHVGECTHLPKDLVGVIYGYFYPGAPKSMFTIGAKTFVVLESGEPFSWGHSPSEHPDYALPLEIPGFPPKKVVQVDGHADPEGHIVFLCSDGKAVTMGRNNCGQLANGQVDQDRKSPAAGPTFVCGFDDKPKIEEVCGMRGRTLFRLQDGTVFLVGQKAGLTCAKDAPNPSIPVQLKFSSADQKGDQKGDPRVTMMCSSATHAVFYTEDNKLFGFGSNSNFQLGVFAPGAGDSKAGPVPLLVPNDIKIKKMFTHNCRTLLILEDGSVWGFGLNDALDFMPTATDGLPFPFRRITTLPPDAIVTSVAMGTVHTLFLLENGRVFGAGDNLRGQLNGIPQSAPRWVTHPSLIPLPTGRTAIAVTANGGNSLVLLDNGQIIAFGVNLENQLGSSDTSLRSNLITLPYCPFTNPHPSWRGK